MKYVNFKYRVIFCVEQVNDRVSEIYDASMELSSNINEINEGLTNLNDAVIQNSAIANEAADTYEALSSISAQMHQAMEKFKL